MERLTEKCSDRWIPRQDMKIGHDVCMRRLAEYEDIGLEPEEIKDIFIVISESQDEVDNAGISIGLLNDLIELAAYRKIGLTPEQIEQLKKEKDYWEREAKKWCAKLGEKRLLAEGGGDNENNS